MKRSLLRAVRVALTGLLFAFVGCAHLTQVQRDHARGLGTSIAYSVTVDEAWRASLAILHSAGALAIDEHRGKGYMLGSTAAGAAMSAGTFIGVWIRPNGPLTSVTVVTKGGSRIEAGSPTTPALTEHAFALTEHGFHRQFATAIGATEIPFADEPSPASSQPVRPVVATAAAPVPAPPPAPIKAPTSVTKDQCIDANAKAQPLRRTGKLAAAREQLAICIDARCPAVVRDDCAQRLDELEHVQPTIVFDAKDAAGNDVVDVRVRVDGNVLVDRLDGSAIAIDPGPHAFSFEVTGKPIVTRAFVLKEGEKLRRERIVIGAH